jgi:hypothetical protein
MIISDTQAPFRSMADGQFYDSKSAYRSSLRARGYREVGNDAPAHRDARDYSPAEVERDIADSIQMIEADHPEASTSTGPRNTRKPKHWDGPSPYTIARRVAKKSAKRTPTKSTRA